MVGCQETSEYHGWVLTTIDCIGLHDDKTCWVEERSDEDTESNAQGMKLRAGGVKGYSQYCRFLYEIA